MQDVALVAIGVVQERDVGAAVGVVLNGFDLGRHAIFIATEIDLAVLLFMPAAAMPDGIFAMVVTSTGALLRFQETLFRSLLGNMAFVEHGHKPPRRRIWIKALQSHLCLLPCSSLGGMHLPLVTAFFPSGLLIQTLKPDYKFSANSIIFSPSAGFT